jgi:phosphatidylinositol-3-phosphatase
MRSLLEGHLNRVSLAIVIVASAAATAVILLGAGGRTSAQKAALVALHEPVAHDTVKVVTPPQPTAPSNGPSSSSASTIGSGGGGGGAGGGGSSGGDAGGSGAPSTDDADTGDGSTSGGSTGGGSTGGGSTGGNDNGGSGTSTVPPGDADLPKVGHVFEIDLSTTGYRAAFRHGVANYLDSLIHKGTLLTGYRSLGSNELADELAAVSGQVPNADTRGGCTKYTDFPTHAAANAHGFVPGTGCVYPDTALTIGDQVTSAGHVWGAFIADQGTKETCVHPNTGALDDVALPFAKPGYDDRHNPFIYFHSLLDLGDCSSDDQDISKLSAALRSPAKTPTFAYVAPDACADARAVAPAGSTGGGTTTAPTTGTAPATTTTGSSTTTPPAVGTNTTTTTTTTTTTGAGSTTTPTTGTGSGTTPATPISGAHGLPTAAGCPSSTVGIVAEDRFLKTWVPKILDSGAYRRDGVLIIAFSGDGTAASGPQIKTGALVLSRWTRAGAKVGAPYTPYSLLRSVEDMLRYQRLAEAAKAKSFAHAVLQKGS